MRQLRALAAGHLRRQAAEELSRIRAIRLAVLGEARAIREASEDLARLATPPTAPHAGRQPRDDDDLGVELVQR